MIEFSQKVPWVVKTSYLVVDDCAKVKATRILDGKVYSFEVGLDGTVGDLVTKVANVKVLTNEVFKDLATIVKEINT